MSFLMLIHLTIALSLYLYTLNHENPVLTIPIICKLRSYIVQSTAMMYRWCLTLACFDRLALSSSNVHLRNFAQIKKARQMIIILIISWAILPVHILIFYNPKKIISVESFSILLLRYIIVYL
jgi:hypothetical protein